LFTPAPAHGRRAHYLFAAALYGILGFHVGVWAVQLAPLSAGLRLDPAALGAAVTAAAATGLAIAGLATRWPGGTTPGPPSQEAREPGAGSRNTRRRAMSSTGTGSPLRMASRRESLPHR
jgi:hypothetical protein